MAEENNLECPNCGEKSIVKPRVYYEVFRGKRQPDGVCGNCGAFYWKRSGKTIPSMIIKSVEQKEGQKPKKWDWFKAFIGQEEKKKRTRRGHPP